MNKRMKVLRQIVNWGSYYLMCAPILIVSSGINDMNLSIIQAISLFIMITMVALFAVSNSHRFSNWMFRGMEFKKGDE